MEFDVLKEIQNWVNQPSESESLRLPEGDSLATRLRQIPRADLGIVIDWLEGQLDPAAEKSHESSMEKLKLRYVLSITREAAGDTSGAAKGYLEVSRLLVEQDRWSDIRELAAYGLKLKPDHRFVRLLVKAWNHLPENAEQQQGDLEAALQHMPEDPELLWHQSQRAIAEGRSEEAAHLAVRAFAPFIECKELDRAEEALFRALELETPDVASQVLDALPALARHHAVDLLKTALDFVQPLVDKFELHQKLSASLETILTSRPDCDFLRGAYMDAVLHTLGNREALKPLVDRSGLADLSHPFLNALKLFQEFCRYRPGTVVEHQSWGLGRVLSNDGETLLVDFENRPGHRMGFEMAQSSLSPLASDLLRARLHTDAEGLKAQCNSDPVALVLQAVKELGGEAQSKDIKSRLAGTIVAESEWAAWWQKARRLVEEDPRIDHKLAFQQIYRLATEDSDPAVELPEIGKRDGSPPPGGLKKATATIRRFLKQHGSMTSAAKEHYGEPLTAWVKLARGDDLLSALPLLLEWFPDQEETWTDLAARGFASGGKTSSIAAAEEQRVLLELGLAGDDWERAAMTALTTRFPAVRSKALQALADGWLEGRREQSEAVADHVDPWDAAVARTVRSYSDLPKERLALIQSVLQGAATRGMQEPWNLAPPVLTLLVNRTDKEVADSARNLLAPEGALAEALRDRPCPEEILGGIRAALLTSRLTEVDLDRVEQFLTHVGTLSLSEELAQLRQSFETVDFDENAPYLKPGVTLMTRSTYAQLQEELKRLERELRVEVPQAIKKARELGDLSENAEYHAARERQGIVNSQFLALRQRLAHVQEIEDLEVPDDVVAVGSEVALRNLSEGTETTVWILGVGDSHHGPEVISYDAPLGSALLGKRVGETFELDHGDDGQTFEILSMRRRLPER